MSILQKISIRVILGVSLVGNIALAIYAAGVSGSHQLIQPAREPAARAIGPNAPPVAPQVPLLTWQAAKGAYMNAKAANLDEPLARRVLAVSLPPMPEWLDPYWKSPIEREAERQQAQFHFQNGRRQDLLQLLGPGVIEEPAFRPLFYPLTAKLPFLSSSKQIHIQEIMLQEQQRLLREAQSGGAGLLRANAIFQDSLKQIQKILNAEEFFEYQLRMSPAAQVLAGNGFDFTEKEFRDVFRVSSSQSPIRFQGPTFTASGQPNGSDKDLTAIEAALGAARFAEYRRAQDPAFKLLTAIGADRGIDRSAILKAYDVVASSAARRTRILSGGPLVTGAQRESLTKIETEQQAELAKTLGAEALEVFNNSLNPQLARMGGGVIVRPRGIVRGATAQ